MKNLILATCILAFSTSTYADEKWSVTVNFAMTGMPMVMPAQTHTVCVAGGEQDRSKMIPMENGCTTSNIKSTATSLSLHIECPAPQKLSGDLKMTYGANSYKGEMTAKGDFGGHQGDIKISYNGKKIGSCSANDNTAKQANKMLDQQQQLLAQQQAMQNSAMAMACGQAANELNYQAEAALATMCPNFKSMVCKVFNTKASTAKGLNQLQLEKGEELSNIADYCGANLTELSAKACTSAKSQQKWLEASQFCGEDAELAALAAKECTGLNFTAMSFEDPRRNYQPICSRYASKARQENNSVLDSGKKALDNVNKLRGVFGF